MPIGTALGLGIAGLGALAGAQGKNSTQTESVDAGNPSFNENLGSQGMMSAYSQLQGMMGAGPGQQDVAASTDASRGFAQMLQQYAQNGAGPSQGDINQGNTLAASVFAPQQTALQQSFVDQGVQADRQSALMGRSINDPILQAKLRTEQMRQSAMLGSQQGSFATQYAMQQPMQRLGFAQQNAQVLGGLATQAMANRQSLAAMGAGIMGNERQYRLQTASRTQSQQSGGGLAGAISGGLGGLASGMNLMNGMGAGGLFGGGGGFSNFSQAGGPVAPNMMSPYSNPYFNKQ